MDSLWMVAIYSNAAISKLIEDGLVESRQGSGTFVSDQRAREGERNVIAVVTTYVDDYLKERITSGHWYLHVF